jgi:hypothetical protein
MVGACRKCHANTLSYDMRLASAHPASLADLPVDAAMPSPLIELEYRLQGGAVRWGLWVAAVLVAALWLAGGALRQQGLGSQLHTLHGQLDDEVREQAAAINASLPVPASVVARDFTAGLPDTPPVADVVQTLSRACAQAGVALAGVQATHRPANPAQLGRTELTVLVRGPYAGARTALDTVLQRYPSLTLQRLRMRRTSSPTDLETSVTLSVWGRPAQGEPATLAGKVS